MATSSPSQASRPRNTSAREAPLPALFAAPTHLLGWQGLIITLPENWQLAVFGGNDLKGDLRVDDEDGPRLELHWEMPNRTPNMERSIEQFLERLEREAKKRDQPFQVAREPRLIARSKKRKSQLVNFGWTGQRSDEVTGQGWGIGWQCAECNRVVVAHVIGRGLENPGKVQRLAGEVLNSLECHGSGGWQTWSVFDLQLELPEEFKLGRAKLMTGRIELEWLRLPPPPPRGWMLKTERIAARRISAANVVLANESLDDWTQRVIADTSKLYRYPFKEAEEVEIQGHPAFLLHGHLKNVKKRLTEWMLDLMLRRRTPAVETRVWHCAQSNKIYVLDCEMSHLNTHVPGDVLDSIDCHR